MSITKEKINDLKFDDKSITITQDYSDFGLQTGATINSFNNAIYQSVKNKLDTPMKGGTTDDFPFIVGVDETNETAKIPVPLTQNTEDLIEFKNNLLGVNGKAVFEFSTQRIDTIEDLRNTNGQQEGQIIELLGYNNKGDAPTVFYKWSTEDLIDNGSFYINSKNKGTWTALFNKDVDLRNFGVFPNTEKDVTNQFQLFLDYTAKNKKNAIIDKEGEYLIKCHVDGFKGNYLRDQGGLKIPSNSNIKFNTNVILKVIPNSEMAYQLLRIFDVENISIKGGILLGERNEHMNNKGEWGYGVSIQGSKNIKISNLISKDMWGDGINLQVLDSNNSGPKNVILENVKCINNRRQGMSIEGGDSLVFNNCEFSYTNGTAPACGVDLEPWSDDNKITNVVFDNCYFHNNSSAGMLIMTNAITNVKVVNSTFADNKDIEGQLKMLNNIKDIIISKNLFLSTSEKNLTGISIVNGHNILVDSNIFSGAAVSKINRSSSNTNKNIVVSNNIFNFKEIPYEGFFIANGTGKVDLKFINNTFNFLNSVDDKLTNFSIIVLNNLTESSIITGNTINKGSRGMSISGNNLIISNNIINNSAILAMELTGDGNIVNNNTFRGACLSNNSGICFFLVGSKNKIKNNYFIKDAINNEVKFRPTYAIYVNDKCDYNFIYDNHIDDSFNVSIRLPENVYNYGKNKESLIKKSIAFIGDYLNENNKQFICVKSTVFNPNNIVTKEAEFRPLLMQSVPVKDVTTENAKNLETAITLVNDLKEKLNAKLKADRDSGQQL